MILWKNLFRTVANVITEASWIFWFGGLTFYMTVVVPVGGGIVGSDVQGEITSTVTGYLNIASLAAAGLVFVRGWGRKQMPVMAAASSIAVASLMLTMLRYWLLARMASVEDSSTSTPGSYAVELGQWLADWSFYSLHRIYLWITTFQWFCGLVVLWYQTGSRKLTDPHSPNTANHSSASHSPETNL